MRLHSLTITAFGPFAGTQRVDFDELSSSGLFLLHGPTGAGKSSVLDAVCFALYGSLPGQRGPAAAARMRSDHAAPAVLTEVRLELSLGGRRLRIIRSPEQRRPKRKGSGTTVEKAQTLLSEWDPGAEGGADDSAESGGAETGGPGAWVASSRSHQEVGKEIEYLLGLNREQFCQVVLLPQGDFARFLQADATQRQELLGRLFDTRRFRAVEQWLAERRSAARQAAELAGAEVDAVVQRLAQAAGVDADGESADGGDADDAARPGAHPAGWAAVLRCAARERLTVAVSATAGAQQRHAAALQAAALARSLADRQLRHAGLLTRQSALADRAPQLQALAARSAAAGRAAAVAPLLAARERATAEHRSAAESERAARSALTPHLGALRIRLPAQAGPARAGSEEAEAEKAELKHSQAKQAGSAHFGPTHFGSAQAGPTQAGGGGLVSGPAPAEAELKQAHAKQAAPAHFGPAQAGPTRAEGGGAVSGPAPAEAEAELKQAGSAHSESTHSGPAQVGPTQAEGGGTVSGPAPAELKQAHAKQAAPAHFGPTRLGPVQPGPAQPGGGGAVSGPALAEAEQALRVELGRLEALGSAERRATELGRERELLILDQADAEAEVGQAEQWFARYPEQQREWAAELADAQEAALRLESLDVELAAAEEQLAAAGHRDALAARAESATVRERAAERSALDAREHRQDLRERRLDGMAAELAAEQLSEGCACPVCGSERHPAPALPSADRVTREQEQRAAAEQEAAEARLRQVAAELRELDAELAAIRAAAGPAPVAELAAGLDGLRTRHHRAARAAAGGTAAEERLAGLAAEHAVRSAERDSAADRLIGYTARLDQLAVEAERLTRDLDLARGDDPSVAARRDRLAPAAAAASAVVRAAAEAEGAAGRADAARSQAVRAAVGAGFADPAEAEAARLGPAEAEQVDRRLAAWREEEAGVRRGLAEPELLEAAALAPADPPAAEARLDGATDLLRAASATEYACREQCRQLDALGRELAGRLVRLAPVEAEFRLADRLSALAGGTGSDNALKMQLQSYVLAARLEQVAAAAGVRLEVMSGGRYTLVHSDEPASNGRRSGLGLRVLDAWTGRSRDTATLSGGESFFCSLALALGLADVVTDEAGGRPLDTLFVDEGFGTLDEETLDEVMDVLDNLRERDRAVGIVSHVADLRRRIPMQLRVRKGRTGSTVQLTGPSAG